MSLHSTTLMQLHYNNVMLHCYANVVMLYEIMLT